MAKAYKCDKCGKYFETYKAEDLPAFRRYLIWDNDKPGNKQYIDLCNNCYHEFLKFLNVIEEVK